MQSALVLPKTSHVHSIISIFFADPRLTILFSAFTASLPIDFYVKTTGSDGLYEGIMMQFPIRANPNIENSLIARTLQLNCLNKYYAPLWEESWQADFKADNWSKQDARLKPFNTLTPNWQWSTPLRNWFERRQALVEIDVITAMALGLT